MLIAPQGNDFSIEQYDHNIIKPNQDQFLDDDKFASPQLTEKFFIRTPYIFTLSSLDKKHDHIISKALCDTQAYESYYDKFETFSLTFHFLTPKERYLQCSHDIMLRTDRTHTYTYYSFKHNHYDSYTPSRQPHHRYQLQIHITVFSSHIALKILTFKASSAIMILSPRCVYSVP